MSTFEFPILYFAYGSNLSLTQMAHRCPTAQVLSKATLPGYRLVFPLNCEHWGGGVAGIEPDDTNTVEGAVYRLYEQDLLSLDVYEAIDEGEYTRSTLNVVLPSDESIEVMTYFARRDIPAPQDIPPSRSYISTIIQGARDHHLPEAYIREISRKWLPVSEITQSSSRK